MSFTLQEPLARVRIETIHQTVFLTFTTEDNKETPVRLARSSAVDLAIAILQATTGTVTP